ncbi:chorismate-binding protein [Brumimicrobium mesophilum]|uniref:chorismate-binding protein n=1 Tax=Brumimicrobium mesophilum TaxID=392717 RepID=UPI000D13F083|nr:chorismate-binding protein [Brumimicrobium mesophilum]
MAYLTYQFPNEEVKILKGSWREKSFEDLPENCFFITDFIKEKSFYFIEEEEVSAFSNADLFFNKEDDVFIANEKAYLNGLQYFIDGFEMFGIEKAIFSRIKLVEKEEASRMIEVFQRLAKVYKSQALVYLVSDEKFGTWIGATPETLLSGNEKVMKSMALAGTKRSEETQWTTKEREEQQYVVDFVKNRIEAQFSGDLYVSSAETVKKGSVYHLQTNFEFPLAKEKWNDLMQSLHPTPAVCGTPRDLAQNYILTNEPHKREFYTGLIGLKSVNELKVYVNLRCMQVLEDNFALYLGGGITLASDIANELQETEDKSETLLSVIFG